MDTNDRLAVFLETFRQRFEPALEQYLNAKISQLGMIDALGELVASVVRDFTVGSGKRVRAALVVLGYEAAGGSDADRIVRPAIAIELLHSFFLIHDDIMDRSALRRNRPTVHRAFAAMFRERLERFTALEREHFSQSMALLAGDLCCAIAYEALSLSAFPAERLLAAIRKMHTIVDATVVGQVLDIVRPLEADVTEEEVFKIHLLKTARYTLEGPLHFGMILGGAADEALAAMSRYAVPVGIAFQVQDDLLGVFGTDEELGKPVISDIEEGKKTLLTVSVRQHGTAPQRERLQQLLGRRGLRLTELEEVRAIMRESGAVVACEDRARQLVSEAKQALDPSPFPAAVRGILSEFADYVIRRRV